MQEEVCFCGTLTPFCSPGQWVSSHTKEQAAGGDWSEMSCQALAQGAGLGTAVPPKTETGGGGGAQWLVCLSPAWTHVHEELLWPPWTQRTARQRAPRVSGAVSTLSGAPECARAGVGSRSGLQPRSGIARGPVANAAA